MIKNFFFILCLFPLSCFALEAEVCSKKQTICLNMIVKNESAVIERCLQSVKPFIDYWVIVDTGSTDGTQEIIKEFMEDLPGELHERSWVNFGHNRNEALELAQGKGDYLLFIDADEALVYEEAFKFPLLECDTYQILSIFSNSSQKYRTQLVNNHLNWAWEGVVYERIFSEDAQTRGFVEGIENCVREEGARARDPEKFLHDAEMYVKALKKNPSDSGAVFFLAQSYQLAGMPEEALKSFQRRVQMGGNDEEVFYSLLQIGMLHEAMNAPSETVIESYYTAYTFRPSRVEPLYHLVHHFRKQNNHMMSYLIADIGCSVPPSYDSFGVEKWMYEYGMLMEFSISAYWVGEYKMCRDVSQFLLHRFELPENFQECINSNLTISIRKEVEKRGEGALKEMQKMNVITVAEVNKEEES